MFLMIGFLNLNISNAFACQCSYFGNIDSEIENSDYILTAKIIEKLDSIYPAYYKIEVEKIWKGDTKYTLILTTGTGGGDCGMTFQIDSVYLIYGKKKNDYLYTNRCSRTIELNKTGDIDYLNYHFFNAEYDSIRFTSQEINYIKSNLIPSDLDSLLNKNISLIFYNGRLITKKELVDVNPWALTVEYRFLSLSDRKLIKPELFEESMNGILILYGGMINKPIKRDKLIKKLNKSTAGNTRYKKLPFQ
jgi:hypothetical protein